MQNHVMLDHAVTAFDCVVNFYDEEDLSYQPIDPAFARNLPAFDTL